MSGLLAIAAGNSCNGAPTSAAIPEPAALAAFGTGLTLAAA